MPTTTTFTTTDGTPDGRRYFQDIEISPVTVKSGALVRRFDTVRYPGGGRKLTFAPTVASVTPSQGAQSSTVEVVIAGHWFEPGATVTVSGTGVTVSNVRLSQANDAVRATFTIAADATASARNVTVTNSDTGAVTATGAFTVVTG